MATSAHPAAAGLERLGQTSADGGLGILGAHVTVRGRPAVERYWSDDVRRDVHAVSQTFTSVAVGIAQTEGRLELDDPILDHLPDIAAHAAIGVEWVTIRHLLQMSSGITCRWGQDPAGDPAAAIVGAPLAFGPGHGFAYGGAGSYLLSRIIAACSGSDLVDYLGPRLFDPLAIDRPQWLRCPLGYALGARGLQLRVAETARLGETLLDAGRYAGREIVPASYAAAMVTQTVPVGDHHATHASGPAEAGTRYGWHVWVDPQRGAWRMDGELGQLCVAIPRLGACISVASNYAGATSEILDAVWSDVVSTLG